MYSMPSHLFLVSKAANMHQFCLLTILGIYLTRGKSKTISIMFEGGKVTSNHLFDYTNPYFSDILPFAFGFR